MIGVLAGEVVMVLGGVFAGEVVMPLVGVLAGEVVMVLVGVLAGEAVMPRAAGYLAPTTTHCIRRTTSINAWTWSALTSPESLRVFLKVLPTMAASAMANFSRAVCWVIPAPTTSGK